MAFTPMGSFSFSHVLQPDTPTDTPDTLKANWDSRANELKTIFNALIAVLEATTDNSSGADNLGAAAISGLSGTTVQSLLEALKICIDEVSAAQTEALTAHKTSTDHDGRYFTETELGSTTDGASGADKTGATAIPGWSGVTVQSLLEAFGTKLDTVEAGATADQTAAEILAALLTVDGAGSGLNAEMVGGKSYNECAYENDYVLTDFLENNVNYNAEVFAESNSIVSVLNKTSESDSDIFFDTLKRIVLDFDNVNCLKCDFELARIVSGDSNEDYVQVDFRLRDVIDNSILFTESNFASSDPNDGTYVWFTKNIDVIGISGSHEYAIELAMSDFTAYSHSIDMFNRGLDVHVSKVRKVRWV